MDEDEMKPFDSSMKKKKKKKKTPFDPDSVMGGDVVDAEPATDGAPSAQAESSTPQEEQPDKIDDDFSLEFGGLKKKKKKKKPTDENTEPSAETETTSSSQPDVVDDFDDFSLDLDSKKKKKKSGKKVVFDDEEDELNKKKSEEDGESKSWSGTDRDYTYDELLQRVFDIMREKNPEMISGEKKKFVMRPPQVLRVGTRKSSFANFTDICRLLHRQPKHVLAFLLAELGTSGSVDGNNQLIIRGKYNQKQIENVLRRYIKEYVTCHTCRSPDTLLQKDTRLYFLQCETCGSRCSVASIKSGFVAVTGKRAAIRAKTT
ncbi:hypothetical protein LOTGIDRAFT_233830 [Lottia gigantea]|uniref:Eukaryotic translation initiation factor 2 subunit 2 n=1 Tax=Lottia gigantea TaxID=225164 RepID=V4BMY2_LOTGI|nr:hypothetical protein LOTGIDRAFT_233830 [Lottia gigantea]ESO90329.1 hypothetical protein LOTGIDRAFT_233830 [Lottia gigantea]